MKVLVTNDDGVASPGLHALVQGVIDAGYEVTVVAPSTDMSGAGASIGMLHIDQHIDADRVDLPGLDGVPAFAVAGPPGLCVLAARLGGFGESPDVVVSGINPGCNTGRAVLHSGTVGAALTAANFGLRGLAVSIDVAGPVSDRDVGEPSRHWRSAATVAAAALPWLVEAPATTVVNINVPDRSLGEIRGARWGNLASFGTVRSAVVEAPVEGGRLQMEFRPTNEALPPDTDTALVMAGHVAITTITGVQATEPVDVGPIVGSALAAIGSG
ncbi:MAG: 5'/3'-nucleotidase SurE [Acidimicrobiales bacterium]